MGKVKKGVACSFKGCKHIEWWGAIKVHMKKHTRPLSQQRAPKGQGSKNKPIDCKWCFLPQMNGNKWNHEKHCKYKEVTINAGITIQRFARGFITRLKIDKVKQMQDEYDKARINKKLNAMTEQIAFVADNRISDKPVTNPDFEQKHGRIATVQDQFLAEQLIQKAIKLDVTPEIQEFADSVISQGDSDWQIIDHDEIQSARVAVQQQQNFHIKNKLNVKSTSENDQKPMEQAPSQISFGFCSQEEPFVRNEMKIDDEQVQEVQDIDVFASQNNIFEGPNTDIPLVEITNNFSNKPVTNRFNWEKTEAAGILLEMQEGPFNTITDPQLDFKRKEQIKLKEERVYQRYLEVGGNLSKLAFKNRCDMI